MSVLAVWMRGSAREILQSGLPLVALVVAVAAGLVYRSPDGAPLVIAATLAVVLGVMAMRSPAPWLVAVVLLVPFQIVVLGRLFASGMPATVLRALGNGKEFILVAGLLALVFGGKRRRAFDAVDRLAIAYVGLSLLYFVLAVALPPLVGSPFRRAPQDPWVLARSLRTGAAFVAVFLVARHMPLTPRAERILRPGLVAVGVVVAVGGLVEYLLPTFWRSFSDWAGVEGYVAGFLGGGGTQGESVLQPLFGGDRESTVRIGSLLYSPLEAGFYLTIPLAIGVQRLAHRSDPKDLVTAGGAGAAVLLTSTRSAAVAALVAVLSTVFTAGRRVRARSRAVAFAVLGLIGGAVVAASSGLSTRILGIFTGGEPSAEMHQERTLEGVQEMLSHPLGLGIGTGPTVSESFARTVVNPENGYLVVGNEKGLLGFALFTLLVVAVTRLLIRRTNLPGAEPIDRAAATAMLGVAVGSLFLPVWNTIPLSWTLWALAGWSLQRSDREADGLDVADPPQGDPH